jgi:hypothetical protein
MRVERDRETGLMHTSRATAKDPATRAGWAVRVVEGEGTAGAAAMGWGEANEAGLEGT